MEAITRPLAEGSQASVNLVWVLARGRNCDDSMQCDVLVVLVKCADFFAPNIASILGGVYLAAKTKF